MLLKIALILSICVGAVFTKKMEGHMAGGVFSRIEEFPHSVFLSITTEARPSTRTLLRSSHCGASVLTQSVLLTAAHCFHFVKFAHEVAAYTGSVIKYKGNMTMASAIKVHEQYNLNRTSDGKDVALVKLEKDLELGPTVKKVALLRDPPLDKPAKIAGWGWVDSIGTKSQVLKNINHVTILDHAECHKTIEKLADGVICGRDYDNKCYPEKGDSGSPLVVGDSPFIQVGIVSYKNRHVSNNTVIYTDVSYYYDWIVSNTLVLMATQCNVSISISGIN